MAQLQKLYSDQDLVVRIQMKSPPRIFSLASLVLEGTLANCSLFNIPSIILRPDKYNKSMNIPLKYTCLYYDFFVLVFNNNIQQTLNIISKVSFKLKLLTT